MTALIPTVLLEEHNEAFYLWHWGISKGHLAREGNTLLHVDEHADLSHPFLRQPVDSLNSAAEVAEFTYSQLGIAGFIWPAIFAGTFTRLVWVKRTHGRKRIRQYGYVKPYKGDPLFLSFTYLRTPDFVHREKEARIADLDLVTPEESIDLDDPNLILDIDLDYIVSNRASQAIARCEIAEAEYERLRRDVYHPFRLLIGPALQVEQKDGKLYAFIEPYSQGFENREISVRVIDDRIDIFVEFLRRNKVRPKLISLCRSKHSGYTPTEWASVIERSFLEKLSSLYRMDILTIQEILPSEYIQGPMAGLGIGTPHIDTSRGEIR